MTRGVAGRKWKGVDVVTICDAANLPVSRVLVIASYSGPNSGNTSGTTGTNGTITLQLTLKQNPVATWCFTVTNVKKSGYSFNAAISELTACDTAQKAARSAPDYLTASTRPNPFNPATTLAITLPEDAFVRQHVYDHVGREVAGLINANKQAGTYPEVFDAHSLLVGIHFYRLSAVDATVTLTMMLVK